MPRPEPPTEIPALSMWKMFNDTISALLKTESTETSVERLANIIKTQDISNIFLYKREPTITHEEYERVADKYQAFSTWVLGRFFHLLSCDKVKSSHETIIEMQMHILRLLANTRPSFYHEMTKEYCKVLHDLVDFSKKGGDKITLKVFIPEKYDYLNEEDLDLSPIAIDITRRNFPYFTWNVVKFFRMILTDKIEYCSYNSQDLSQNLKDLIYLLSEAHLEVKFEILGIYLEILKQNQNRSEVGSIIQSRLDTIESYFEGVLNEINSLDDEEITKFQPLLISYVKTAQNKSKLTPVLKILIDADGSTASALMSDELIRAITAALELDLPFPCDFPKFGNTAATIAFCLKTRKEIADLCLNSEAPSDSVIKVYEVNTDWSRFCDELYQGILDKFECDNECGLGSFLKFFHRISGVLLSTKVKLRNSNLIFFEEDRLLLSVLTKFHQHNNCLEEVPVNDIVTFLTDLPETVTAVNLMMYMDVVTSQILGLSDQMNRDFVGSNQRQIQREMRRLNVELLKSDWDKSEALEHFGKIVRFISCGFFEISATHLEEIGKIYLRLSQSLTGDNYQRQIVAMLPHIFSFASDPDFLVAKILIPNCDNSEIGEILPKIACMSTCDFLKIVGSDLNCKIFCTDCHLPQGKTKESVACEVGKDALALDFSRIDVDITTVTGVTLKCVAKLLVSKNQQMRLKAVEALQSCCKHIKNFHSPNFTKLWVNKCGDENVQVRRKFCRILPEIFDNLNESEIESLLTSLETQTKLSLRNSDYDLQLTLIRTIENLCSVVKSDGVLLPLLKLVTYFIMVPTSKHSLIAVNVMSNIAEKRDVTPGLLYRKFREELSETIVHLCIVNRGLIDSTLATSLVRISLALEYFGVKDFVGRECKHLLPYFISKATKNPQVESLVEEMALLIDSDLAEMLAAKYGTIFLHVFLTERKDGFKECMTYLEQKTGQSGPNLRKRNFKVILNDLLLHFHTHRDKVILALKLLSQEDAGSSHDVPSYLQSLFLGLLQYFDLNLTSVTSAERKNSILLSLSDLFRYMGPKHISPLRYKIIATLRTDGYSSSCEVWDAFVTSCDVEALAPQLATIFVSLLPLLDVNPLKINEIFRYLLVENENVTTNYISDLFFVENDERIDGEVAEMIKRHLSKTTTPLRTKIQQFLRHLSHETVEVRTCSLRHLKALLEENREEVDRMILGYNGIDPIFVELIEMLALGCREKNETFKLACGDVIGELGAVEPSHLPRKCAENCKTFTFFMEDDVFIGNALGELSKAFQGAKNTHNVDRFGLAIQELLKNYQVSPHVGSSRNNLWMSLPEAQQELMVPFLTSRYITKIYTDCEDYPCPIFGTNSAASFQTWLIKWTCSLISTLPTDSKSLLNACLPAMRQERRVLMTFLPHLVLHSVAGGCTGSDEKSYAEMSAVISSFDVKKPISEEAFNIRPFAVGKVTAVAENPEETIQTQCTKVAFVIFDFLERWVREWQWQKGLNGGHDPIYEKVKSFLKRFCKLQLAKCNYRCAEYPRALMYLEDYVTENPGEKANHLTFLAEIYAHLDEPDGVAGVTALRQTEPSIEDRILPLKMSGKLTDAASCYERMAQPLNPSHMRGLFQCYLELDSVNTALNLAKGASTSDGFLFEAQAEPLWRLGRYEELETLIKTPRIVHDSNNNNDWGIQIGKALLALESGSTDFRNVINNLKLHQIEFLGATTLEEGSYQNGYEYISRLHSLNEIEQVARVTKEILIKPNDGDFITNQLGRLRKEWELRLKIVQESTKIIEPLLCLRRVALEQTKRICEREAPLALSNLDSLLGECWLLSARLARKCGNHQQAYSYALKAEEYKPPRLFLEKAKLFWMREEHEQALATLQRGVEFLMPKEFSCNLTLQNKKLCAEAKLLIAVYNDATSNVDTEINITHYKDTLETFKEWEKPLVLLAQFFDRIFKNLNENERDDEKGSMRQLHMINYFGKSLMYGTSYVYQSMPRLLSIWFDYGTRLLEVTQPSVREFRKGVLLKMTKLIDNTLENLPAYVFLTAFSQLVSRICHPQKEVYIELKSIIIKLLLKYPQHTLWMIISVIKSGYSVRAKRCAEILGDSRLKSSVITGLVNDFTLLAEKLIELCNKEIGPDVKSTTVSNLLRSLPRLLKKEGFNEIMIPTFKFRKLVLPNPDFSTVQHNPFPNHYVHIIGIEEEVTVLHSLQRPRKITFKGSDGKGYVQMLKPKDDLRKDFRLMEFNDIVNQLLIQEAEARQRRLSIRLYSVAPLNEECGLVEWIPNLLGLRPIVLAIYKQKGLGMSAKDLKSNYSNIRDPLAKKRDVFTKHLLPTHPPVLGEWFRRTFPDAQSWLIARTAYIRTTAVMSMVGYILGLGDRHGENINFDATCGDVVHVDFNCLFNKGETLEWPERVPFRLTPNMVAAMGPLGVEGMFRKSCACTLRVLRSNSTTLMSIVTPFVYDPLVSWPRNIPGSSQSSSNAERTNELAFDHIKNIELRLQGIVKTKTRSLSIPLSVEGQTNNLIKEATSVDNLCQMFVGWGSYL